MTHPCSVLSTFLLGSLLASATLAVPPAAPAPPAQPAFVPDTFNYVLGTQTFSPSYHFTRQAPLQESAQEILEMGSNVIKFRMEKEYATTRHTEVPGYTPGVDSLVDLAQREPSFHAVFNMPFAYYVIWAYPFHSGNWKDQFGAAEQKAEYQEMHDFAAYLLRTYNHTGKKFFLGHWEGDWLLRGLGKPQNDIPPAVAERMIHWLNTRQAAIDDARRETPHENVEVYGYTEVNLVQLGLDGKPCLTNTVLPKTNMDYVSYSSYDTASDSKRLTAALNYIEQHLPPKPGIPGKRVLIGEYGFPENKFGPIQQEQKSRAVMRAGLAWGCPFVLYWEMYNNEIDKQGRQRGFWLIDDKGNQTPTYRTLQSYYRQARQYVVSFESREHRPPTADEFRAEALRILDSLPAPTTQPVSTTTPSETHRATSLSSFEGIEEPTVLYHTEARTFTPDTFPNITDAGPATVRFTLRYHPDWWDGDRATSNNDRQRAEVKGLGPHQFDHQTFLYTTDFRTDPDFKGSDRFCHVFQLKALNGDNGAPLVTLSLKPDGHGALQLWSGKSRSATAVRTFTFVPGQWTHAEIRITTSPDPNGAVQASINHDPFQGATGLPVFRPAATSYRPKWGFYRGTSPQLHVGDDWVEHRNVTARRLATPATQPSAPRKGGPLD